MAEDKEQKNNNSDESERNQELFNDDELSFIKNTYNKTYKDVLAQPKKNKDDFNW